MEIIEQLKKERPTLSTTTLKTYSSLLGALHRRVFGAEIDLANFKKTGLILDALKVKAPSSRKTTLSALFVLTGAPEYRDAMTKDIEIYREDTKQREMNDKQKAAFKSQEEIKEKLEALRAVAEPLLKRKQHSDAELMAIQDYITLALTSGAFIPPRRSLDWTLMRIKDVNKQTDNYIDKNRFIFNTYKGSAAKGAQSVDIPKPLQDLLKKWIKINPHETLLFSGNGTPLNSVKLNQRLNKILGKGASINVLRHSYLSTKYQDSIDMERKMAEDMEKMGSSSKQKDIYVQKI